MGRSAPSPAVAERLARLELDGAVVRVIAGDVARDEDVRDGPGRDRRHAARRCAASSTPPASSTTRCWRARAARR